MGLDKSGQVWIKREALSLGGLFVALAFARFLLPGLQKRLDKGRPQWLLPEILAGCTGPLFIGVFRRGPSMHGWVSVRIVEEFGGLWSHCLHSLWPRTAESRT